MLQKDNQIVSSIGTGQAFRRWETDDVIGFLWDKVRASVLHRCLRRLCASWNVVLLVVKLWEPAVRLWLCC